MAPEEVEGYFETALATVCVNQTTGAGHEQGNHPDRLPAVARLRAKLTPDPDRGRLQMFPQRTAFNLTTSPESSGRC